MKCLRCGAGSEWLQGVRVSEASELLDRAETAKRQLAAANKALLWAWSYRTLAQGGCVPPEVAQAVETAEDTAKRMLVVEAAARAAEGKP